MLTKEFWYKEALIDISKEMLLKKVLNRLKGLDFDGLYSMLGDPPDEKAPPRVQELWELLHSFFKEHGIFPYRHVVYGYTDRVDRPIDPEQVKSLDHVLDLWDKYYKPMWDELWSYSGWDPQWAKALSQAHSVYYDLEWGLEVLDGDPNDGVAFQKWAKEVMAFIADFTRKPTKEKVDYWQEDIYPAWKQTWEEFYVELDRGATFSLPDKE